MFNEALTLNPNPSIPTLAGAIESDSLISNSENNLETLSLSSSFDQNHFESILQRYLSVSQSLSTEAVIQPDLVINRISTPTSVVAGNSLNFNYTIKNRGTASTGVSSGYTDFYLSTDNRLDTSDIHLDNDYVASLGAGVARTESTSVTFDSNLRSGDYYLLAKADGSNVITESSETNNVRAKAITITETPQPDLAVSNLTTPTIAAAGDYINFNYAITNQGTASTDLYGSNTKFFLSSDRTLDSLDTYLGSDYIYYLEARTSSTQYASFSLDENLAGGTYYIFAQADGDNTIIESNEANNLTNKAITVAKPDLVINNLSAPTSTVGGDYLRIDYTITNQGSVPTGLWNTSDTEFYLSTNTTLDSSDIYLGSDSVYSFNAGTSQTDYIYAQLSEALTTGTYYIFAVADGDNTLSEGNESNNLLYQAISITEVLKPDLTITNLTTPNSVTAGITLDLNFTLKNQGDASTDWYGNYTHFYLSLDNVLDSSDTYLDKVSSYSLEPGTSRTESASIALSSKLAGGTYYLFAKADGDNDVFEKNENNNLSSKIIQVIPSLDGYSGFNGHGLVNASAVISKALGQNPFPSAPNLGGNDWGADLINAPEVWAKGYTGQGIIVAVLDTGVDRNHSDLSANIWKNTREIASNGIDDDHNGYTDDVWGWNFDGNNNNTMDSHSHGTHVSGTIAGVKNNFGVTGIAYNAKIMPVKVLSDSGSGSDEGVARGIRYAADNGANVINMSLGGDEDNSELRAAVEYAAGKGVIVVMAAGNESDTHPHYPGSYATNWGIVVGAVDRYNEMADFSNRASGAKYAYVTAPGVSVYSTVPNNGYDSYNGTSMATPHVAGVVALLLSAKRGLTDAQVRQLLTSTAENSPTASNNNTTLTSSTSLQPEAIELTHAQAIVSSHATVSNGEFSTSNVVENSLQSPVSNVEFTLSNVVENSRQSTVNNNKSSSLLNLVEEQTTYTNFDLVTGLVFQSQLILNRLITNN